MSDSCGGERWRWWHACVRVCVRDSIKDAGVKVGAALLGWLWSEGEWAAWVISD